MPEDELQVEGRFPLQIVRANSWRLNPERQAQGWEIYYTELDETDFGEAKLVTCHVAWVADLDQAVELVKAYNALPAYHAAVLDTIDAYDEEHPDVAPTLQPGNVVLCRNALQRYNESM